MRGAGVFPAVGNRTTPVPPFLRMTELEFWPFEQKHGSHNREIDENANPAVVGEIRKAAIPE